MRRVLRDEVTEAETMLFMLLTSFYLFFTL